MLAAIGAGLFVALLALAYLFASGMLHETDTGIVLPENTQNTPIVNVGGQLMTAQSVADVEIGLENARGVIESLARPREYSCKIRNTLYYTGGSSALECRQYVHGDAVRTDTLSVSGALQSTLLRQGDTVYAWDTGDNTPHEGSWGDFSNDAAAMLPTYEDTLAEGVQLTDAGREDVEGEPCIRVSFEQGGYRCVYYISAASGLLKTARFYSGETLTREVTVSELKIEPPDEELFSLPDGRSVLGEEP